MVEKARAVYDLGLNPEAVLGKSKDALNWLLL